jgi:hypothetical protein
MFSGIFLNDDGLFTAMDFRMNDKEATCFGKLEHSNSPIAAQLLTAISVMNAVDDLTYRKTVLGSSVGQQFRHILDIVDRLLEGVTVGKIDFSNRRRDKRVEKNREFAIERFKGTLGRVAQLSNISLNTMVAVRSEADRAVWLVSSLGREVDYVTSHSIHHYALIAAKLAVLGINCEESFGIAPSTLEYRERLAA